MLMIHAGPLYSAVQAARAANAHHHQHAGHESATAHAHHGQGMAGEPEWLAALELCGYCELLTLNPPLTLSVALILPRHEPAYVQPLPEQPLPQALRRSSGHPRAPPHNHC
ncbi:DUF2946 family protein [Stutzerimonas stutzeri]|uniref:DUF2946 domain-containing protein n=1 Tax=Stutzerimonas stutzeri TaxID=316 RepID=A0A6I6M1X3_STUST|nr:DUF2946 family protein [Stutzerimonas stutzeri]QGZ32651.1 DUF2946 domain-containing protein [Stutzerimonas stutzeri]